MAGMHADAKGQPGRGVAVIRLLQDTHLTARLTTFPSHSAELASKLHLLESKLLHGERSGGLDKLAKRKAAEFSRQQEELRRQAVAEAAAAQRIAALEADAHIAQSQHSSLQVGTGRRWAQVAAARTKASARQMTHRDDAQIMCW